MKAVIPAAGRGTRFLPVTKEQPKEMLPVLGKPVIQYVVEEAVAAGVDDILVVTGRGKRAIEDHFDRSYELECLLEETGKLNLHREIRAISELADVFYVRQGSPRGLGHAISCAAPHTDDESFYVLLGDVIVPENTCLPELAKVHKRFGASVIAVTEVLSEEVSQYGIIAGEEIEPGLWRVTDLVEKPAAEEAPSNLAVFGRYLLTPKVMKVLPDIKPGRGGEIQLTDALREVLRSEEIYAVVGSCAGYDTGNVLAWLKANVLLALENEELGPLVREGLRALLETDPEHK